MRPYIATILLITFFSSALQAQQVVKGIVVDSTTFNPLPFVSVMVKGTYRGTSTDGEGGFSIVAAPGDTLVLSMVGYETVWQPLWDWEPSIIRMKEKSVLLKSITVESRPLDPYEGMFDEQNEKIDRRKVPFYFSREKKEKRKLVWLAQDNLQARTYVDVMINNPGTKEGLMKKYALTENEYYRLLGEFNAINHRVMYYLTAGELLTLVNNFYALHAKARR